MFRVRRFMFGLPEPEPGAGGRACLGDSLGDNCFDFDVSIADFLWVIGSIVVIAAGWLTPLGNALLVAVGLPVNLVLEFESEFISYMGDAHPEVAEAILGAKKDIPDEAKATLDEAIKTIKAQLTAGK